MKILSNLFLSPAKREAKRKARQYEALSRARSAVRRERRWITKRQSASEDLRRKAVEYEQQGRPDLAKQMVRQFAQAEKEINARSMAVNNMEHALHQLQSKDNYEEFTRGLEYVTHLEGLAHQVSDPDVVRERIADLAQRNQDLIEPWTEAAQPDDGPETASTNLSPEEQELYDNVVADAASGILEDDPETASMDQELQTKMDETLKEH